MATSTKTLTPTNQTVTIPDMTERPNVSLLTDGIGKEADAINALSDQIAYTTDSTSVSGLIFRRFGRIGIINIATSLTGGITDGSKIWDVPANYKSNANYDFQLFSVTGTFLGTVRIVGGGNIEAAFTTTVAGNVRTTLVYNCAS